MIYLYVVSEPLELSLALLLGGTTSSLGSGLSPPVILARLLNSEAPSSFAVWCFELVDWLATTAIG